MLKEEALKANSDYLQLIKAGFVKKMSKFITRKDFEVAFRINSFGKKANETINNKLTDSDNFVIDNYDFANPAEGTESLFY
jgi:hypothetical protein